MTAPNIETDIDQLRIDHAALSRALAALQDAEDTMNWLGWFASDFNETCTFAEAIERQAETIKNLQGNVRALA